MKWLACLFLKNIFWGTTILSSGQMRNLLDRQGRDRKNRYLKAPSVDSHRCVQVHWLRNSPMRSPTSAREQTNSWLGAPDRLETVTFCFGWCCWGCWGCWHLFLASFTAPGFSNFNRLQVIESKLKEISGQWAQSSVAISSSVSWFFEGFFPIFNVVNPATPEKNPWEKYLGLKFLIFGQSSLPWKGDIPSGPAS